MGGIRTGRNDHPHPAARPLVLAYGYLFDAAALLALIGLAIVGARIDRNDR